MRRLSHDAAAVARVRGSGVSRHRASPSVAADAVPVEVVLVRADHADLSRVFRTVAGAAHAVHVADDGEARVVAGMAVRRRLGFRFRLRLRCGLVQLVGAGVEPISALVEAVAALVEAVAALAQKPLETVEASALRYDVGRLSGRRLPRAR
jgi:hypothetical protein